MSFFSHTHIDIDGRNALYTTYLFGRKEAGGRVERVNTLSKFDEEIAKAYKQDRFRIKRLGGLLDVKAKWNMWLGYSKYGTTRNTSAAAKAQGGREEEPMCLHFFRGQQPGSSKKTLMQYKYRESDSYWMPYNHEGIVVFSDYATSLGEGMFTSPDIAKPKDWPDKDKTCRYLLESSKLSAFDKMEWKSFFDNIPQTVADIPENKRFKWLLPEIAMRHKVARGQSALPAERVGESSRPEKPDERVVHPGFTEADLRKAQRQRAENFSREQLALQERKRSEQLARTGKKKQQPDRWNSEAESSSDSDSTSDSADSRSDISKASATNEQEDELASQDCDQATSSRSSRATRSNQRAPPKSTQARTVSPSSSKKGKTAPTTCSLLPMGESGVIEIGDILMFSPDKASREADRQNNYLLGVNLGKVIDINPTTRTVNVWWYHGTGWTRRSRWIEWREPVTKKAYTDWVAAKAFLVDSFGTIAKIKLEKGVVKGFGVYAIALKSLKVIHDVLATNDEMESD